MWASPFLSFLMCYDVTYFPPSFLLGLTEPKETINKMRNSSLKVFLRILDIVSKSNIFIFTLRKNVWLQISMAIKNRNIPLKFPKQMREYKRVSRLECFCLLHNKEAINEFWNSFNKVLGVNKNSLDPCI